MPRRLLERLPLLVLVWGVALVPCRVLAATAGSCEGGPRHDGTVGGLSSTFVVPGSTSDGKRSTWGQFLTSPHAPYRYTSVCTYLADSQGPAERAVTVEFWGSRYDSAVRYLRPTNTSLYSVTDTLVLESRENISGTYLQIAVDFVSWEHHAFMSVSWEGSTTEIYGDAYEGDAIVYAKRGASLFGCMSKSRCLSGSLDLKAVAIRASGEVYVPKQQDKILGWNCTKDKYGDGTRCDCNCGIEDPDCFMTTRQSDDCLPKSTTMCLEGRCVAHRWNTSVPRCSLTNIFSDDLCDCGCGDFLDPDCTAGAAFANGSCSSMVAPKCVAGNCYSQWVCDSKKYGDGAECNCNCGTKVDPDCTFALPTDCPGGDNWLCYKGVCTPNDWICTPSLYHDGIACTCGCGVYDVDCDNTNLPIQNCPYAGDECSYDGGCIAPKCGNGHADASLHEDCDSGYECLDNCSCRLGFKPTWPRRADCVPWCGDNRTVWPEECDGGPGCLQGSCKCRWGYVPTVPVSSGCKRTGLVSSEEQTVSSSSRSSLHSTTSHDESSRSSSSSALNNNSSRGRRLSTGVWIIVGVGGGLIIACLLAIVILLTVSRRSRSKPATTARRARKSVEMKAVPVPKSLRAYRHTPDIEEETSKTGAKEAPPLPPPLFVGDVGDPHKETSPSLALKSNASSPEPIVKDA